MITKKFGEDFFSEGGALTLEPGEVSDERVRHLLGNDDIVRSRTHDDGWTVSGKIHEDYYYWVNYFEAEHPTHGKVWGDFESEVYADSEEGFEHFYKNHTPEAWDYGDI